MRMRKFLYICIYAIEHCYYYDVYLLPKTRGVNCYAL